MGGVEIDGTYNKQTIGIDFAQSNAWGEVVVVLFECKK